MFSNVERRNYEIKQRPPFDENCEDYRCCCECCHLKTGATIVGVLELLFLAYFLASSVFTVSTSGGVLGESGSASSAEIVGPFGVAITFIGIGLLSIILLFVGILRRSECMLIPHLILQIVSVVLFLALIIICSLAIATDRSIFYRLTSSVPFEALPDGNTVNLGSHQKAAVITVLTLSCVAGMLEVWFFVIVFRCYKYLSEKAAYVRYCHAYSMPMKSVSPKHIAPPIPQYYHG